MGEEFNISGFMRNYGESVENAVSNNILSDGISTVVEILNISVFLIDIIVIGIMFFRCRKFRQTRAYDDFAGTGKLAKALEIVTIFLAIDSVYSLTRLFSVIDAVNLVNEIYTELLGVEPPAGIFVYPIAVGIVLPILSFILSVCVWNMYHNTKKLFYSIYPNGVLPVPKDGEPKRAGENLYGANISPDLSYKAKSPAAQSGIQNMSDSFDAYRRAAEQARTSPREEDIFGTGASVGLTHVTKDDEARMEELLIQDEPVEASQADENAFGAPKGDDDIFGAGNASDWQPVGDLSDPALADMLVSEKEDLSAIQENAPNTQGGDEALFGSGATDNYRSIFTTADDDVISELLVQDESLKE